MITIPSGVIVFVEITQVNFPRNGGQEAENLRNKNRHVYAVRATPPASDRPNPFPRFFHHCSFMGKSPPIVLAGRGRCSSRAAGNRSRKAALLGTLSKCSSLA